MLSFDVRRWVRRNGLTESCVDCATFLNAANGTAGAPRALHEHVCVAGAPRCGVTRREKVAPR